MPQVMIRSVTKYNQLTGTGVLIMYMSIQAVCLNGFYATGYLWQSMDSSEPWVAENGFT